MWVRCKKGILQKYFQFNFTFAATILRATQSNNDDINCYGQTLAGGRLSSDQHGYPVDKSTTYLV